MFQFIPNMGIGGQHAQFNPLNQPAASSGNDRQYYTGTIDTSKGGPNDSGYGTDNGPKLGPSGYQVGQGAYGVIPIGGYSQLGGRVNGAYSGYYNPDPTAPIPGTTPAGNYAPPPWLAAQTGPQASSAPPAAPVHNAPHASDPGKMSWGGGIGTSDNSAWGNALGPTYEKSVGGGPLQASAYQPQGHTNQALPMGYGSVFGLGGGR